MALDLNFMRSFADEIPAICYFQLVGPDGQVREAFVSAGIERLLGYTPEEWAAVWEERIHPEDREKVLAACERFWRGESGEVEFRYLAKDGRAVWVRERARAVRRGEEVLVYGVLTDITSEVLAHQALEAVLAAPQEEIIYVADPGSYEILYLNPAGKKLSGDPSGRRCYEAFQGRDSPCPFCTNELILREPGKAHVWLHRNERNGRYYRCTDRAIPWPDGQLVRFELAVDVTELVQAERQARALAGALEESERRFRKMLDEVRLVAVMLDREGRITYANPYLLELTGWSWEEVEGKDWFGLFLPEDVRARVRAEAFNGAIESERLPGQYENEILTRDGRRRLIRWSSAFLRAPGGEIVGTASIGEDVTEARRQERLREAIYAISQAAARAQSLEELGHAIHEALHGLLPAQNLYLAVQDPESGMVSFPYFGDRYGLRPAPRRGWQGLTELVMRAAEAMLLDRVEIERLRAEGTIRGHDPTPRQYLGVPLLDEQGRSFGVVAIQAYSSREEITADHRQLLSFVAEQVSSVVSRFHAQEALRESEARYRLVVEGGAEAIAVIAEGKVLFANRRAGELAGLPAEELLGREYLEFVHPEDRELVRRTIAALLRGERAAEVLEFRLVDASGKEHWVEVRASAALWEGKEGVIVFLTDVSERKRLEEQYRQAQKMEGIGRLAGGMAHDFNNILTAIIGYASFALEELGEAHPAASDIREILANAGRASELTRRLLALSRRTMLSPRALDLNELVLSLHRTLRRLLSEDIELVTLPGENLWAVRADPAQMEQVILNLVVNARDAMPSGGKLTIETANVELDADYARGHLGVEPGQYVLLAVSDTGIGMSEEVKSHLFEPFFTTKEVGKGTGLGLATVYGIVKQHGGHIYVYSELGRGTTFKIYLPRHYGEAEALGRRDEEGFVPRGSETVLVVEDEPAVRVVEVRVLREQGYRVLEAANGVEAMRVALAHPGPIHLLVTDVVMPQMSGRELAERLRRIVPQLRVLYLSGYTDNAIVHHGVLDEGVAFLQKPFTAVALARKVREVLDS